MHLFVHLQHGGIPGRLALITLDKQFDRADRNRRNEIECQKRAPRSQTLSLSDGAGWAVEVSSITRPRDFHGADQNHKTLGLVTLGFVTLGSVTLGMLGRWVPPQGSFESSL